jgi:predicted lipoprotein with Yx(FWY)xxD motif
VRSPIDKTNERIRAADRWLGRRRRDDVADRQHREGERLPFARQEVTMRYSIKLFGAFVASATVAAVAAALALAGATNVGGATVMIAKTPLGRILVDSKGRTLYDFPPDKGGMSSCYGACAALWPPLTITGTPHAGAGVRAALLGITKRSDGKLQVTYNRHPLYSFVSDTKPGQATGQGVNQFGAPWWVLSPAGKEIHHV